MNGSRSSIAPLTGIVFVILMIVGFAIGGEPPNADDPVNEIVEFYSDNDSEVMFGSAIATIGLAFFMFYAGYLRKVLRAAEGGDGYLSLIAFSGAAILATGVALDATINFALAETVEDIEPTSTQTLLALWNNDFLPLALGQVVFLMATGISIVRHCAFPKWIGWVLIVASLTSVSPAFFVALIVMALFVIASSIMMSRASGAGATTA